MKPLILLAVAVLLSGCGKAKPPASGTWTCEGCLGSVNPDLVKPSHEAQVYAELWGLAKEHHLKYRVMCFGNGVCKGSLFYDDSWSWVECWPDALTTSEHMIRAINSGQVRKTFDTGEVKP